MGNNLHAENKNEDGRRTRSSAYLIACKNHQNCVITDNVLAEGDLRQLLEDQSGHAERVVLKDNPGTLFKVPE